MPATSSTSSPCEARLWRSKSVILYFILRETVTVKAEPNVRIRVRGAIIRIQITETRIRTIIRISRQEGTHDRHNPLFQNFNSRFLQSTANRQKRHKRNPRCAPESEERLFVCREPKPAVAPSPAAADRRAPYHPTADQPAPATGVQ